MKKIIFLAIAMCFCSTARAKTQWEQYLSLPTPHNAKLVTQIKYTPGAIPKDYGYWAPDLKILQNQIIGGDTESLKLAFRLCHKSDGGLLEDLIAIIGRSIRPQPKLFLETVSELNPQKVFLKSILLNTGLEYTDRPEANSYEIEMRRKALSSINVKALQLTKDNCLNLIEKSNN